MSLDEEYYDSWEDEAASDMMLDGSCPCCSIDYDEIDYEYQICHRCGFANKGEVLEDEEF